MTILLYPLATEKAINMVERNNTIIYVVNMEASKTSIKKEFEDTFKVKVENVNVMIDSRNSKRAYIKLAKQFKASDIALKLKLV